jgi:hypothetical protein
MVLIAVPLVRRRVVIEERARILHKIILLIGVFAILMLLHVVENCIWAGFYYWSGVLESYETALYFSFSTYTTIGYGDVLLPQHWRLLGALEGISGVLLCGLSTAFLFAVVNALFQFRMQRMLREADSAGAKPDFST